MPTTSLRLSSGDLLPRVAKPPQGSLTLGFFKDLDAYEAPGINTLVDGKGSLVWLEALGSNVLDAEGNVFLDFTSGFGAAAIGHRHPRVVEAVRDQAERLLHGLGDVHAHPSRIALARRLCSLAPVKRPRVYFAISGADAVEIALKTSLLATGKPGILAFEPSYHGLTLGALHATSRSAFRQPFAPYLHSHLYRLPFASPPPNIDDFLRAHPAIGAVIVEPIVGREGVLLPPEGWLSGLAEICRRQKVLLIADEIFTGFGRTGEDFVVADEGVLPDLLCCGKALGGGLPIAAVIGREDLMSHWKTGGEAMHTATFTANPLACSAALATLEVLRTEDLARRAKKLGTSLGNRLKAWANGREGIANTRGRGFLWGIETTTPRQAKTWAAEALRRGLIVLAGGPTGSVLQLAPALTVSEPQLDEALKILDLAWQTKYPALPGDSEP